MPYSKLSGAKVEICEWGCEPAKATGSLKVYATGLQRTRTRKLTERNEEVLERGENPGPNPDVEGSKPAHKKAGRNSLHPQ